LLGIRTFRLTPSWQTDDSLVLVEAFEGHRLCREEGWEDLPPMEALREFDWARGGTIHHESMSPLRHFAAFCRLTRFSLRDIPDHELLDSVREAIRHGNLLVLRPGNAAGKAPSATTLMRRLITDIDKQTRGKLSYQGRQYKLVADVDLARVPGRDSYEVASRAEAVAALGAIARDAGAPVELLNNALEKLSKDWRPPFSKADGLILLRRIPVRDSVPRDVSPSITPAQLKKLAENHWIEIEVVDLDGKPCSMPYKLQLPGQSSKDGKEGAFDDDGFVGVYDIPAGTGTLVIGASAEPLTVLHEFSVVLVDELNQPLGGVDLDFSLDDSDDAATTDDDGRAKVKQRPAMTGTVHAANEKPLRQLLYDRWQEVRGEDWFVPPADDTYSIVELKRGEALPGLAIAAEKERTVVFQPRVVRARLLGMWFDTDKCFLLPTARKTLPMLSDLYEGNPESDLLVVGHTDTAGKPSYNDPLSLERAESLAAFLRDDVDAWLACYGAGKPAEKRWGETEDTMMIVALAEQNGDVIPDDQPLVAWYQKSRGIDPVDNTMGPVTRRALIGEYMSLDGTTLPEDIRVTSHGCGENFPIAGTADGQSNTEDRRVELFFFDNPVRKPDRPPAILPPAPGKNSKPGAGEYPEWVRRARATHDFFPGGDVEVSSHISVVLMAHGVLVRNRPYKITLDGGVVLEGTTDDGGFLQHHDVPPGDYTLEVDGCQTTVPTLPEDAERRLQVLDDYWDDTDDSTLV
jgi:outer membrane protein OmpA-like peptidoglycan-associated protein